MTAAQNLVSSQRRRLVAYIAPMFVFIALLPLSDWWRRSGLTNPHFMPEFWVYPVQAFLCGALLIFFWREYEFQPVRRPFFTVAVALFVFVLWISPQQFFGRAPRLVGFNPDLLARHSALYWLTIALRFLRLVVVVPLLEEIFWRGFLLRYLIDERFERVSLGAFSCLSFFVVVLAFGFSHSSPDWPAAFITGALYNVVAYRTRSLSSCICAHGLTNLALGCWIMRTKEWGFW